MPRLHMNAEQRALWQRVRELWEWSRSRDVAAIDASLHDHYVGWDMSGPAPHDRAAALAAVTGTGSPQLGEYELHPLSVQVYEHQVGVVHYRYRATVVPMRGDALQVTGRWTEVYLKKDGQWLMITVSGRPDPPPEAQAPE